MEFWHGRGKHPRRQELERGRQQWRTSANESVYLEITRSTSLSAYNIFRFKLEFQESTTRAFYIAAPQQTNKKLHHVRTSIKERNVVINLVLHQH